MVARSGLGFAIRSKVFRDVAGHVFSEGVFLVSAANVEFCDYSGMSYMGIFPVSLEGNEVWQ
jgi:hypothetical protein